MTGRRDQTTVAFLAGGRLFAEAAHGGLRELPSPFAQQYVNRANEIQSRHAWKYEGQGARFMTGGLGWGGNSDPGRIRVVMKGLARGAGPDEVWYTLDADGLSGLFCRDLATQEERRLYHSADHAIHHLALRPGAAEFALTVFRKNGTSSIALFDERTATVREVTEGDSVDLAPSWHPAGTRTLVFQSAGVGRDAAGEWAELGPFSIQRLSLDESTLETALESPGHDFLNPRIGPDGRLWAIRRPRGAPAASWSQAACDALMVPVRLGHAVFQYLNYFTAMYTGKPLTPQGIPRRPATDMKHLMIWGNLVDAEQAAREARQRGDEHPALVPSSWELVRQDPGGAAAPVASSVLSFDMASDGSVVYSNGSAIWRLDPAGQKHFVLSHDLIEQVVVLAGQ